MPDPDNSTVVHKDANGVPTGFTIPQGSVEITDNDSLHYVLHFKDVHDAEFKTVTVQNPSGSTSQYGTFTIEETSYTGTGSSTRKIAYAYDNSTSAGPTWTMTIGSGDDRVLETKSKLWTGDNCTLTHTVYDKNNQAIYQSVLKYQQFPWGQEAVEKTVGTGADARTGTWSYYDDPNVDGLSYGRVKLANHVEGYTDNYTYTFDSNNQIASETVTNPFKTTVTTYTWQELNGDNVTDLVVCAVESINGQEIARTYGVYLSPADGHRVQYEIDCAALARSPTSGPSWAGPTPRATSSPRPSRSTMPASGMTARSLRRSIRTGRWTSIHIPFRRAI